MNLLLENLHWWSGDRQGHGDLRLRSRRVEEISRGLAGRRGERHLPLPGRLALPGLINCHDHLDLDLLPRLGRPPYANSYEWAREIYRPESSPIRDLLRVAPGDRLRWGGLRNLVAGATTVVHHDRYQRRQFGARFPVRVLQRYGWTHSLGFGRDPQRAHRRSRGRPFLIHLAEGVDEVAEKEIERSLRLGLLDEHTVMVHGIALDPDRHRPALESGCSLVWCPSSSLWLYGRCAPVDRLKDHLAIGLGTDSTISGPPTLLDELRAAAETGLAAPEELLRMVTTTAADIFGLDDGRGRLVEGGAADVVVLRDGGLEPAESVLAATLADIEFVVVAGEPRYASAELAGMLGLGAPNSHVSGAARWLSRPPDRLLRRSQRAGGEELIASSPVCALFASAA